MMKSCAVLALVNSFVISEYGEMQRRRQGLNVTRMLSARLKGPRAGEGVLEKGK